MIKAKFFFDNLINFIKTKNFIVFCAIVVLNILFRSINLTQNNLWFDEQFSLFWSQFKEVSDVKSVSQWDVVPPGFNVIVHYWTLLFGISEFSIRFLSCLAMSLTGGLIYLITKNTFNFKAAVIATILFLANSNLFYYSQESRSYACQMFLVAISSWLFISLIKKPNFIFAIFLGAINYYLFYTHFATVFLFFWQFMFAAFYFKNKLFIYCLLSAGIFVFLLYPFIPRVLYLIQSDGQNFWLEKPTLHDLRVYLEEYFNRDYIGGFLAIMFIIGLVCFIINFKKDNNKSNAEFIYFFLTGFGLIALSYIESVFKTPLFFKRYVLISNVGVIICVSYVLSLIPFSRLVFSLFLSILLVSSILTINYTTYKGWNYKRQIAIAKLIKTSRTAIITDSELGLYYYDPNFFHHVTNMEETINKENIYAVYDTVMLNKINFSKFDKIVVCNTWKITNDIVKPILLRQYHKSVDVIYTNDNCRTHVYSK